MQILHRPQEYLPGLWKHPADRRQRWVCQHPLLCPALLESLLQPIPAQPGAEPSGQMAEPELLVLTLPSFLSPRGLCACLMCLLQLLQVSLAFFPDCPAEKGHPQMEKKMVINPFPGPLFKVAGNLWCWPWNPGAPVPGGWGLEGHE